MRGADRTPPGSSRCRPFEPFEVPTLAGRDTDPLCRRQSEQRADRGAIDPQAGTSPDAELFSTSGEQSVQGVDPGDDRAAFDPCDRRLGDPRPGCECPLGEPRAPPRVAECPGCIHEPDDNKEGINPAGSSHRDPRAPGVPPNGSLGVELDDEALVEGDRKRDLVTLRVPREHPRDLFLVPVEVHGRLRRHFEGLADVDEVPRLR